MPWVALSRVLTEEQGRHVREHLSEEELTIFDILTRPCPQLTTEEREEVKKAARQLLARLHELLVLGWRQKLQARARVRIEIENLLNEGLPRAYGKEMYEEKCGTLFEHVFESYQGRVAARLAAFSDVGLYEHVNRYGAKTTSQESAPIRRNHAGGKNRRLFSPCHRGGIECKGRL